MSNILSTLEIGSKAVASGITQTSRNNVWQALNTRANDLCFNSGFFGYSVTQYRTTGVPSWAVEIYTNLGTAGSEVRIAGFTGIGSTAVGFVPIDRTVTGTTDLFIGVPRPYTVDIVGSSTTVGATFGIVLTAVLVNP